MLKFRYKTRSINGCDRSHFPGSDGLTLLSYNTNSGIKKVYRCLSGFFNVIRLIGVKKKMNYETSNEFL